MDRRPWSLSPSQLPASGGRVSGTIAGVTVSVEVVVNARVIDTRPNESATRTRSGPIVYLPRMSAPSWYVNSRDPPPPIPSNTNRGRDPGAYGTVSSASSSPVRRRETLIRRMVSAVVCPAGSREGIIWRTQDSRYLARPDPNADSSGSAISSAPIRSRSGSGISSPQTAAAAPAATRQRPEQPVHDVAGLSSGPRQRGLRDDPRDDLLRQVPLDQRLGGRQQPVREHRDDQGLDVIGDDVVPAVERGPRPGRAQQLQRGPRRRAQPQLRRGPGRGRERDDVLL